MHETIFFENEKPSSKEVVGFLWRVLGSYVHKLLKVVEFLTQIFRSFSYVFWSCVYVFWSFSCSKNAAQ